MSTIPDQIDKLFRLLQQGAITREQFESQRDRLLQEQEAAPGAGVQGRRPSQVGGYRISEVIGEGGMGTVYRGRHRSGTLAEHQGGDVALKVMHPQYARNPDYRERFEREADLGLKLDHPNIVKVLDLIVDGGELALVMEYVQGESLSHAIGEAVGPLPWPRAWPLFQRLLDAVGTAHDAGVVHRDLKPDNVLLTPDGEPHVIDFGIAKDVDSAHTRTGTGMGTVEYMAPEQYTDAKAVDRRADIYSLGMILYEMLAGRLPWEADAGQFAILEQKVRRQLMSPSAFCADIPPEVVAALSPALAVDPAARPPTTAAFRAALEAAGQRAAARQAAPREPVTPAPQPRPAVTPAPLPRPVPPQPRARRGRLGLLLAVGCLGLTFLGALAAAGLYGSLHRPTPAVSLEPAESDLPHHADGTASGAGDTDAPPSDEVPREEPRAGSEEPPEEDPEEAPEETPREDEVDALTHVDRARYDVTLYTDRPDDLDHVVRRLERKGYQVDVRPQPNDDWNIKWGSASDEIVDEILSVVARGVHARKSAFERKHIFTSTDNDIFVNVKLGEVEETGEEVTSPPPIEDVWGTAGTPSPGASAYGVTIFTDRPDEVTRAVSGLQERGYTVAVSTSPNSDWNIKWGAAPTSAVTDVLSAVAEGLGVSTSRFERKHVLSPESTKIFVNIRFDDEEAPTVPTLDRGGHPVVLFTDRSWELSSASRRLESLGYDVSIQGSPNADWNIKWGAAPTAMVDEVLGAVASELGVSRAQFERKPVLDGSSTSIFVNVKFEGR